MDNNFEFAGTGGAKTRGHANYSLVHVAETWQIWAFLWNISLILLLSFIDVVGAVLVVSRTWTLLIIVAKPVAVVFTFYLVMVNRCVRSRLVWLFDRFVKSEKLS